MNNYIPFAEFWRSSLSDAELGRGKLDLSKKKRKQYKSIEKEVFRNGRVPPNITHQLFKYVKKQDDIIKVIIRPVIFRRKFVSDKVVPRGLPPYISPIVSPLFLNRSGLLFPAGNTILPRDILSPLDNDAFVLGSLEQFEEFSRENSITSFEIDELKDHQSLEAEHALRWGEFYETARKLFDEICEPLTRNGEFGEFYESERYALIYKSSDIQGVSDSILRLYRDIKTSKSKLPLFSSYCSAHITEPEPVPDYLSTVASRLAHSNDKFALATAQRDSLSAALNMKSGEILAINGPPGTGKTTFVLSAVASLWVKAALEKTAPPVIVAASTNNQAVTNVIDAFGKDFSEGDDDFAGRWISEVDSYGSYFPSSSRKEEAEEKGYQTQSFFDLVEKEEKLEESNRKFITQAKTALNNQAIENLEDALILISSRLDSEAKVLATISERIESLGKLKKQYILMFGDSSRDKVTEDSVTEVEELTQNRETFSNIWERWQTKQANIPIWEQILRRFGFLEKRYQAELQLFIKQWMPKEYWYQNIPVETFAELLRSKVKGVSDELEASQQRLQQMVSLNDEWKETKQYWERTLETQLDDHGLLELDLDGFDKSLDTQIRFRMFRLAVHYWEAQWLITMREKGKSIHLKGLSSNTDVRSWQLKMMLTPCAVSTFHSLPKTFRESEQSAKPLFNAIDLLIVDEAGQVSPDVAGASFSLAKKALVIGDINQIPPVRGITWSIELGNALKSGAVSSKDEYESLLDSGRSVTKGSVMHIAQAASRYHFMPHLERGMYLLEHRRCYDELINYSNTLCYKGELIPKKGTAPSANLYPAYNYLHVDGKAVSGEVGSKRNCLEALTIASWLSSNKEKIEQRYGKGIHEIVGIVTPFAAQAEEIQKACVQKGISVSDDDGLTVGTVHKLQGSEREIVLFSAVYSKHSDGDFIDNSPSMLNVAVSRAKDSFIVFGDMDVLSKKTKKSPSGLLWHYLSKFPNNQLLYPSLKRADLFAVSSKPEQLTNAKEHDDYLTLLIPLTRNKLTIVSPWLIRSRLENTGYLEQLARSVNRGVQVTIYTDKHFNTTHSNKRCEKREKEFGSICRMLEKEGIQVKVVNGVHSKLVMADDRHFCQGSFNWFSAAREGRYANMETSVYYSGDVADEIAVQQGYLDKISLKPKFEVN